MAIGNWIWFDTGKTKLQNGGLDLDTDTLKMAFFKTSAGITRASGSIWSALASEIAASGGYTAQGKTMTGCSIAAGGSAGAKKFTHSNVVVTGPLTGIRWAVIVDTTKGTSTGDRPLVAFCALSTAQFNVTTGNTITVGAGANGAWDLSGATS